MVGKITEMKLNLREMDQSRVKKKSPELNPGLFQGSMFICCLGGNSFLNMTSQISVLNVIDDLPDKKGFWIKGDFV